MDTFTWPVKEDCSVFGNDTIKKIYEHFKELLVKNGCDITKVCSEWLTLKTQVIEIVKNQGKSKIKYLEVWQKVFKCMDVKEDCSNVSHLIELVLIVPFTNTKVERLFSRMNKVKIVMNRLKICLRIGEEGLAVDAFNLDPVIELWLSDRVCHLKSGPHESSKCAKTGTSCEGNYIDLDEFTMSDLENSDNKFLGF